MKRGPGLLIRVRYIFFFLISQPRHLLWVIVTQKNHLNETVHFSMHNIMFKLIYKGKKIIKMLC